MTLSTTASRVSYSGNGATTTFNFAFKVWAAANLDVYLRDTTTLIDTLQTLTTHYSVDIATYPNTGNVVFVTAPPTGKTVVIVRDMPLTQELDLIASGAFAAENVEIQLDKLAGEIQTLRDMIARTLVLPPGTALADLALPEPTLASAASWLAVNSGGNGFILSAAATPSANVSVFMATVLDDANAAAARTTLGLGNISTVGYLTGSATIDFASVADNASSATSNVTVTGAVAGDFVVAISASGNIDTTNGVTLIGAVTAANTVGVALHNDSGGAFDAVSQTIRVLLIPKVNVGL